MSETENHDEANPPDRDATAPANPGGDPAADHDDILLEPDDANGTAGTETLDEGTVPPPA